MNKSDLIAEISKKTNLTKKDSDLAISTFFEVVSKQLSKGEKIQIVGFGTFETRHRKARIGRNPSTGEEIKIADSIVPAFKAGKALKDAVSKSKK